MPHPTTLGANCPNCPLKDQSPVVPKPLIEPRKRALVLCGEAPGETEVKQNAFFVGPTGDLVNRRILPKAKVKLRDVHLTNALLCRSQTKLPPKEWNKAIVCCRPRLSQELEQVQPKAIVAFGAKALKALTNKGSITQALGAPIPGMDFFKGGRKKGKIYADFTKYTVVPTFHPARMFRDGWHYMPIIRIHVLRAREIADGTLPEWSWGVFYLDVNQKMSSALTAILNTPSDPIAVDLEWKGAAPIVSAITCIGFANSKLAVSVPWDDHVEKMKPEDVRVQGVSKGLTKLERTIRSKVERILTGAHLKILQNGISDRMVMRMKGIDHAGPYWDLLHAHLLISPGTEHTLDFQACVETHAPRWKQTYRGENKAEGFEK